MNYYYELVMCVGEESAIEGDGRLMGIYENFIELDRVVRYNISDIFEYTYDYAVINIVPYGLYPMSMERFIYQYNFKKEMFEFVKLIDFNNIM